MELFLSSFVLLRVTDQNSTNSYVSTKLSRTVLLIEHVTLIFCFERTYFTAEFDWMINSILYFTVTVLHIWQWFQPKISFRNFNLGKNIRTENSQYSG